MTRAADPENAAGPGPREVPISLRIQHVSQLFQSLDPYPFRERDLDADVEDYVVGWARDLHGKGPLTVEIHMPEAQTRQEGAGDIGDGFRNHFRSRAEVMGRDLHALLNTGRVSLAIGLAVLALTIAAGTVLSGMAPGGFLHRFADDGLIIVGWVALWRPIDIFLFEWWPIVRRRRQYERLARAEVVVVPEPDDDGRTTSAAGGADMPEHSSGGGA